MEGALGAGAMGLAAFGLVVDETGPDHPPVAEEEMEPSPEFPFPVYGFGHAAPFL
jgi:hypothetical protein